MFNVDVSVLLLVSSCPSTESEESDGRDAAEGDGGEDESTDAGSSHANGELSCYEFFFRSCLPF